MCLCVVLKVGDSIMVCALGVFFVYFVSVGIFPLEHVSVALSSIFDVVFNSFECVFQVSLFPFLVKQLFWGRSLFHLYSR